MCVNDENDIKNLELWVTGENSVYATQLKTLKLLTLMIFMQLNDILVEIKTSL